MGINEFGRYISKKHSIRPYKYFRLSVCLCVSVSIYIGTLSKSRALAWFMKLTFGEINGIWKMRWILADPFTTFELQNPSYDVPELRTQNSPISGSRGSEIVKGPVGIKTTGLRP